MKMSEINDSGWTVLGQEKSQSTENVYTIRWQKSTQYPETGIYSCECTGFITSKKRPKTCRHIERFKYRTSLDLAIADFENRGFLHFQSEGARLIVINRILEKAKEIWGV